MLKELKRATNVTTTLNGAVTHETSEEAVLDFFAVGAALRNRNEDEKVQLFTKAFFANPQLAMKALFYTRDARGGQGERDTFRTILQYMAFRHPEVVAKNIQLIPHFGRFDDLYVLFGTPLEGMVINLFKEQLAEDVQSENPSLLAKWLASENTSSPATKALAKATRKGLGLSPKDYRQTLSALRKRIAIVESQMSAKQWGSITYEHLPSKAGLKYRNAFYRNDEERYTKFIEDVTSGKKTVNASVLFPYEIVREYATGNMVRSGDRHLNVEFKADHQNDALLTAMWKALPDYVGGDASNALAVVDTSGSMRGLPIEVALSLGLYLAERNKGVFQNHFLTFSKNPKLQEIMGHTLGEKLANMAKAEWMMNTDIEAVFKLILDVATANELPQSEVPSKLFIISDMEFDSCVNGSDKSIFDNAKQWFEDAGYVLPEVIFWNVNSLSAQFPVTAHETGTALVSGCSPSIFKNLLAGKDMTPYSIMLEVLNDERYEMVQV